MNKDGVQKRQNCQHRHTLYALASRSILVAVVFVVVVVIVVVAH